MSEISLAKHDAPRAARQPPLASLAARLTLGDGLLFAVALLAGLLRFVGLGRAPLSPTEAETALGTWAFWQPATANAAANAVSPAYFTLTGPLTQLLGDSDAVMRLVPALFGLGLVLLPWLLRARLGNIGALTASLLLAASPLSAAAARTAGGEAIALFALLLTAVAALRYAAEQEQRWLLALGGGLALGLASAPLFYSGLATLLLAWLVQQRLGPPLAGSVWLTRARQAWTQTAVFALALFVALSTLLLWHPAGLGSAAQLPARWLGQFRLTGEVQALLDPFLALARYEVVLLILGLLAILWVTWRNDPLGNFLTYWLLGGLLLMLLQRGAPANALIIPLPGALLLGLLANALLARGATVWTWALTGGLWLMGMLIWLNVARFLRTAAYEPENLRGVWLALFALILIVVGVYAIWARVSRAALQALFLGALALLLYYQWGTGWRMLHTAPADTRERWVAEATDPGVRLLVALLEDVSRQTTNARDNLEIFSTVDAPALRWYLRDFRRLEVGAGLPPAARGAVIITPAETTEPRFEEDYVGTAFGLRRVQVAEPAPLSAAPLLDALRWWLFHESGAPQPVERVIIWVRADLVK